MRKPNQPNQLNHRASMVHIALISAASWTLVASSAMASTALPRTGVTNTQGRLQVTSNNNWGGSVVSFKWNGYEYVDVFDAGREMQAAAFIENWPKFQADTRSGKTWKIRASSLYYSQIFNQKDPFIGIPFKPVNPNEAGSSVPNGHHASATVSCYNSGNRQISVSKPMDWDGYRWGFDDNAVQRFSRTREIQHSNCRLGKELTLGFISEHAARYKTTYRPPVSGVWRWEAPTIYMLNHLNNSYSYDAATQTLINRTNQGLSFKPSSGYGGCIYATSNGSNAIGIYGVTTAQGGSIDHFTIWKPGTFGNVQKCAAVTPWGQKNSGNTYNSNSYIVVGSLNSVKIVMRTLYNNRGSVPK